MHLKPKHLVQGSLLGSDDAYPAIMQSAVDQGSGERIGMCFEFHRDSGRNR
jgi:hypothetical protein